MRKRIPTHGHDEPVKQHEFDHEISGLRAEVVAKAAELAKLEVERSLKIYKIAAGAFVAGFALFIAIGLLTKGQLFEGIVKSIYPPETIYKDIAPQMPATVWSAMTSGTAEDYQKFVTKREFYDALRSYHTELIQSFLNPDRARHIRASEIVEVGKIPEDVYIQMVGSGFQGKATSRCHKPFNDNDFEAIVVIPEVIKTPGYSWFDCRFGFPDITLAIEFGEETFKKIRLVGVRRNGKTKDLQVLVSKPVAKKLNMPAFATYKASGYGRMWIAEAK